MLYDIAVVIFAATGINLALVAFRSGLRQFGIGIAVTNVGGYGAFLLDVPEIGLPLVFLSVLLILVSRKLMKTYAVGPFAAPDIR